MTESKTELACPRCGNSDPGKITVVLSESRYGGPGLDVLNCDLCWNYYNGNDVEEMKRRGEEVVKREMVKWLRS